MGRCHRTPRDVLDDSTWGAFQAGWTQPVGGDADHLEELEDIDNTAAAGFVFYTFDPKAEVDPEAEHADPATIKAKVEALDWSGLDSDLATFTKTYIGQRIDLEHEAVELDEESVLRAMAKYGPSLIHAMAMYRRLKEKGIDCEVEFAVDETDFPTKPAEHVVVVSELKRLGMDFISFAPRFVGRFEKGVEYIGDLDELQARLRDPRGTRPRPRAVQAVAALRLRQVLHLSADRRGDQGSRAPEDGGHQLGRGAAGHREQRCRSDAPGAHPRPGELRGEPQELPPVLRPERGSPPTRPMTRSPG